MPFRSLIFFPAWVFLSFFVVTVSVFLFLTIKLADKWLLLVAIRGALNLPPFLLTFQPQLPWWEMR